MTIETVKVPDIGSSDPVDVIEWLVKEGDVVAVEQSLLVLESAKASVEVPSPVAGRVVRLQVPVGSRVNTGDALLEVETQGADETAPAANAEHEPARPDSAPSGVTQNEVNVAQTSAATVTGVVEPAVSVNSPVPVPAQAVDVYAGPAVRKLARQMGVDLATIKGTGPLGRLTREDLLAQVAQRLQGGPASREPEMDFSRFGDIHMEETSTLRRTLSRHLQQGWHSIPQVTQNEMADITSLEAFRQAENLKQEKSRLSLLAFVARSVVAALRAFPRFNASLTHDSKQLVLKKYIHLGIAVDTERGLLVPVVRDADRLNVTELATAIATLAEKARNRRLLPMDLEGASFSITSLGGIGGGHFSPLVNAPEVAILGVGRATLQPVWWGDELTGKAVPRLLLPLSLSYDHRVVDGAEAARFLVFLRALLEDTRRLLL